MILERGEPVEARQASVEAFRAGGPLKPESNIQFGEGGAGTFSDGKLNTGIHDPRVSWVLRQFYEHGADEAILYDARPHIGTDRLQEIVRNIRSDLLRRGAEIRFGCRFCGFEEESGVLRTIRYEETSASGEKTLRELPCRQLILAPGHSARDCFELLHSRGIPMERKAFAMGLRIEHSQALIDLSQYGRARGSLPPADYHIHVHLPDGTGVYSFCMCPGGEIMAAASEPETVVTNGMSRSKRDGANANAALLVGLKPEDIPGDGPLAGMYWQRAIERAAFEAAGRSYRAPAQRLGDFLDIQSFSQTAFKGDAAFSAVSSSGSASPADNGPASGPAAVSPLSGFPAPEPTYRPGVVFCGFDSFMPLSILRPLREAIPRFGRMILGFDHPDALLTGPETRSSSPVRLLRDADCRSALQGLYPCGEGAGYAGGITSAAVDGIRCAEAVLRDFEATKEIPVMLVRD